jgi:D-arabinose 1-dehydrogenase-like Zn-dependent alcohol dehydrogenase
VGRDPYPAIPGHEIAGVVAEVGTGVTGFAVVGLGGLGHMAVKLAKAIGADVTVLSQSLRKRDDGYYATSDDATFTALANRFDLIIDTVSAALGVGPLLGLVKTDGALVDVGAPAEAWERVLGSDVRYRFVIDNSTLG